jgi:UPF0755 protein
MDGTTSYWTLMGPTAAKRYLLITLLIISLVLGGVAFFVQSKRVPPIDFPVATPITIPAGTSVSKIVKIFKENHVVQSELLLYTILLTKYTPKDVKASTYVFDKPYDVFAIAEKLAHGDFTSSLVRLTHREGESVEDLAAFVHAVLPDISEADFITKATPYEGTLFPETYFLPPHFTAEDVIKTLHDKYESVMSGYRSAIASSNRTEGNTIVLASIVEREANSPESMAMVAGILEHRLAIHMPLQADATLEYALSKPLSELTAADLDIESPYNSYKNKGLPPTAIGNPGKTAIEAVIHPTENDYLYYITDKDGVFHYAVTFEEHKKNIARYLK